MLRRNDNGKIICDRPDCLCHTNQEQHNILTPDQPTYRPEVVKKYTNMLKAEPDGTAGHSKGNWYSAGGNFHRFVRQREQFGPDRVGVNICEINSNLEFDEVVANSELMALAQHAPHDCGDPECPGVINKRKLEFYDRFQECIKGFAEAGLLT